MRCVTKKQQKIRPSLCQGACRTQEVWRGIGCTRIKKMSRAVGRRGKRGEQQVGISCIAHGIGHLIQHGKKVRPHKRAKPPYDAKRQKTAPFFSFQNTRGGRYPFFKTKKLLHTRCVTVEFYPLTERVQGKIHGTQKRARAKKVPCIRCRIFRCAE